jgi:hypothetical protein
VKSSIKKFVGVCFALSPFLLVFGLLGVSELNYHAGTKVTSTEIVSGFVTCCINTASQVTIEETKPAETIMNARFGPTNLPLAASIHDFWVRDPKLKIPVDTWVSVRAVCVGTQAVPVDTNDVCTVEEVLPAVTG